MMDNPSVAMPVGRRDGGVMSPGNLEGWTWHPGPRPRDNAGLGLACIEGGGKTSCQLSLGADGQPALSPRLLIKGKAVECMGNCDCSPAVNDACFNHTILPRSLTNGVGGAILHLGDCDEQPIRQNARNDVLSLIREM